MRIFKTRGFARFQRKEGIDDATLCEAVWCAERGLIDANLGYGLIKQRVARRIPYHHCVPRRESLGFPLWVREKQTVEHQQRG